MGDKKVIPIEIKAKSRALYSKKRKKQIFYRIPFKIPRNSSISFS